MNNTTNANIDDHAAQWAARSLSGDMPAVEHAALEAWLDASAAHRDAYERYMDIAKRASDAGDAAALASSHASSAACFTAGISHRATRLKTIP